MPESQTYSSWLLRIWSNQDQNSSELSPTIQIQVENIQTGQNRQFDDLDELFSYLTAQFPILGN